jgi:hypothetical protein
MDSHGVNRGRNFEISRRTPINNIRILQMGVIFITVGPIFSTGRETLLRTFQTSRVGAERRRRRNSSRYARK